MEKMAATKLRYVTLDEVKNELNIALTDTYRDFQLDLLITAASGIIKNHLGSKSVYQAARDEDDEPELDSNFEPIIESFSNDPIQFVRPEVKQATLMLVRALEDGDPAQFGNGTHLPPGVKAVLYHLRDPQLK